MIGSQKYNIKYKHKLITIIFKYIEFVFFFNKIELFGKGKEVINSYVFSLFFFFQLKSDNKKYI